jgi:hypothetical protein
MFLSHNALRMHAKRDMARADVGAHRSFAVPSSSRLNQTLPDGVPYQAGCLMSIKFLHNGGAMCGRGLEAYSESFRNLLGTLAVCNQLHDLLFTAGQEGPTFAGEGQQVPNQLGAFLAELQCLLEPGERGVSLWQIVKRYAEAPSNGGQNCVKVLGHQGTKVADLKWTPLSRPFFGRNKLRIGGV